GDGLGIAKMRLHEAEHTLVRHLGGEPEGVGLERVAGVDPVRKDRALALDLEVIRADPSEHPPSHVGVAQVQQMAGTIEAVAGVLERDRVPPRPLQPLEDAVGNLRLAEREGRAHARQACAQHRDRCLLLPSAVHGSPGDQCASFQFLPAPTSTTNGTSSWATFCITSRISSLARSTSPSGTSNTSSSWTVSTMRAPG